MTINITLEAKPLEYKVEIPGYGIFNVRHLGAGAEADLMSKLREAEEKGALFEDEFSDIIEQEKSLKAEKNEEDLIKLKQTSRYQKAMTEQRKNSRFLEKVTQEIAQVELGLWDSDNKEALKRFMNDFTIKQIRGFYQQVMERANSTESNE